MWKMAMKHPVTGIVRYKLDIARLRHSYQDRISRTPRGLRLSSSFRAGHDKTVAMKMNGVVVHAEVDQANPHTLTVSHDQRSCRRSRFAIEGEPVELHVHGVRHRDVWQDGILLQNDCEVSIGARLVWFLRMHYERADHPHHFLH